MKNQPERMQERGRELSRPLVVLSLGAGVQSTTLALMAAHGEVEPMPDVAIFADTQWEPGAVYDHLQWLRSPNVLPYPVDVVTAGDIRANALGAKTNGAGRKKGEPKVDMPYHTSGAMNGMIGRQCTKDYKIIPITKRIREHLGLVPYQNYPKKVVAEQWYGISLDEIQRCKVEHDPRTPWMRNRYPLVEMRMTRHDCLLWLERNGYPRAPRSACVGCPFHNDREWREMRDDSPEEWDDAVEFDYAIRESAGPGESCFLHGQRVPLDEVNLTTPADRGQLSLLDECDGMCGL